MIKMQESYRNMYSAYKKAYTEGIKIIKYFPMEEYDEDNKK